MGYITEITNQLFVCANTRCYLGDHKKSVEHLKAIKEFGDFDNTACNFDVRNNCFFILKRNSLLKKDLNSAFFELDIEICFKFFDFKDTFLTEGDQIRFVLIPLSKIDLFDRNIEDLKELYHENDSFFNFFSTNVEKVNTVYASNFSTRALKVKQQVTLSPQEVFYVLKAEAWKADQLISVFFILFFFFSLN